MRRVTKLSQLSRELKREYILNSQVMSLMATILSEA